MPNQADASSPTIVDRMRLAEREFRVARQRADDAELRNVRGRVLSRRFRLVLADGDRRIEIV
jgi:hypothetical protein